MINKILIIGNPRIGKSTLLRNVIRNIPQKTGFVTNEIRVKNDRVGFEVESHLGNRITFGHIDFRDGLHVGRYGLRIKNLESVFRDMSGFVRDDVLYIDEIGCMQLFSERFKELVIKFMNSENIFLGTLSQVCHDDFIMTIKHRDDVFLVQLVKGFDLSERVRFIVALIGKLKKANIYISEPERFFLKSASEIELRSEHGTRKLVISKGLWKCNCTFFLSHQICSHSIAVAEFLKGVK